MECACRITQSRANKQKWLHKSENDKYKNANANSNANAQWRRLQWWLIANCFISDTFVDNELLEIGRHYTEKDKANRKSYIEIYAKLRFNYK